MASLPVGRKSLEPLSLTRPASTIRTIEWKGKDDNDGKSVVVVMKPLSQVDSVYLPSKIDEFIVEYVTGGTQMIDGKEKKVLPKPIAALGDETVVITEGLCRIIALLMICQVGTPSELYSFQEWAHILCIPEFQREAMKLSAGLLMSELTADQDWLNEDTKSPLASTSEGESASSRIGLSTSEPTPKSPIEATGS